MRLNTMAAVMSFISRIETDSALFYEAFAKNFPDLRDICLSWSKQNRKFERDVKQTYFGVITDTIESNYAFEGLNTADYDFEPILPETMDLSEALRKSDEIEKKIQAFYLKAGDLSDGLMADIPRLFKRIAKKREDRIISVASL